MAKKQKNKAKNQSSGKITIANIIALVGLVLLLVFTFIGHSYMSGGEIGWDILIAVVVTAVAGGLLWFMIKCKGAANQLDKWKKIEIATLVAYILFAIPASLFGGIMHFFVVNDNKEQIKNYAQEDIAKIDSLYASYENFEKTAIEKTGNGLKIAIMPGKVSDASLNKFMTDNRIERTESAVETFIDSQRDDLVKEDGAYGDKHLQYIADRNEIINIVNNWSIIQVPTSAKKIDYLASIAQEDLSELSHNALLPDVDWDSANNKYTIVKQNQEQEFALDTSSFKFRKALQDARGFSVTALIVVLLIHLMILFNYFVARRTDVLKVGETRKEEDGGTQL
ncbi:MAG: hypothetical protein IKW85_04795 [Muribaculaceae bacterium]|nr:hypothetical protein [Muribaculaceae bacterium]